MRNHSRFCTSCEGTLPWDQMMSQLGAARSYSDSRPMEVMLWWVLTPDHQIRKKEMTPSSDYGKKPSQGRQGSGDFIHVYKYLMGGYRDRARLLGGIQSKGKRIWAQVEMPLKKPQNGQLFMMWVCENWHWLPREVVASPSFQLFKLGWTWPWATCSS